MQRGVGVRWVLDIALFVVLTLLRLFSILAHMNAPVNELIDQCRHGVRQNTNDAELANPRDCYKIDGGLIGG